LTPRCYVNSIADAKKAGKQQHMKLLVVTNRVAAAISMEIDGAFNRQASG
jgi:hypothetical protein